MRPILWINTGVLLLSSASMERTRRSPEVRNLLATLGQFTQVEQVLTEAIERIPHSGQLHFSLGRLYETLARYSEAAREFETALGSQPLLGDEALYVTLGGLYVTLADFDRAADTWTRRIDRDPNSADVHRRLGEAYLRQDRDDESFAEFLCALWIDPRSAEVYGWVAQLHLRSGRYAAAAEASGRAVRLDPRLKDARYILGTALMRLGQGQEATKQLEEFQRLQVEAAAGAAKQYELERLKHDAAVSIANAEYGKAAGLLRDAVTLESGVAATQVALGFALMMAGHPAEAIEHLHKSLQLEAGPEAHRYLAEAYQALGRLDESRSESAIYQQLVQRLESQRLSQIK